MSSSDLIVAYIGKQTVYGTAVAASAKVAALKETELTPKVEARVYEEMRGTFVPGYSTNVDTMSGEAMHGVYATYEDIGYYLDSLFGEATPTNASGVYTRTYAQPIATSSPRINTLYQFAPEGGHRMKDALLSKLTLKCETNEPMMLEAEFTGTEVEVHTPQPSSTDRDVNIIHGNLLTFFLDDAGTAYGTTALATCAHSMELEIDTKRKSYACLGNAKAVSYLEGKWEATLKLMLSFNASTIASGLLLTNQLTVPRKNIRIEAAPAANRSFRLDFSGAVIKAPKFFDDADDVTTVEIEMSGIYDSTQGGWLKARNVNAISTLP